MLRTYFDDSPLYARHKDMEELIDILVSAEADFGEGIARMKLKLSPKGACICTNFKTAQVVAKALQSFGVTVKPEVASRDVGVAFSGGAKRCNQLFEKAPRRARTVKRSLQFKGCNKLFSGSGYCATTWGRQIGGIDGPDVLKLERHAAQVTGIRAGGRCRFIANCVVYGPNKHPFARIIADVMKLWFKTLEQIIVMGDKFYNDLQEAWVHVRDTFFPCRRCQA